ncbi:MAG TPA: hypothetical protein PKK06_14155 [Phycisphaerae bacterium]|nr:hypothetical protein [Phycisphaerae bacterium]HNU46433.1 hypothetical protein [Phycisphaerae bacterium]
MRYTSPGGAEDRSGEVQAIISITTLITLVLAAGMIGTLVLIIHEVLARQAEQHRRSRPCGRCGNHNPAYARFCAQCGQPLA